MGVYKYDYKNARQATTGKRKYQTNFPYPVRFSKNHVVVSTSMNSLAAALKTLPLR